MRWGRTRKINRGVTWNDFSSGDGPLVVEKSQWKRRIGLRRLFHFEAARLEKTFSVGRIMVGVRTFFGRVLVDHTRGFEERVGRSGHPQRQEKQGDEFLEALHAATNSAETGLVQLLFDLIFAKTRRRSGG